MTLRVIGLTMARASMNTIRTTLSLKAAGSVKQWSDVQSITAYVPDVGVFQTDFRLAFEFDNGNKDYFNEKDKGFIFLLHKIKENLPMADISFIDIDRLVTPRGQFIVYNRAK